MNMTRIVFIVLGVLAFGLFVRLWVGPGSYPDMQRLEEKIAQQNAANDEQAEVKRRLQMDVVGLSKDDEAVEEHARSELGMVRQGETFYQVILRTDQQVTAPGSQAKLTPHVE
jgi:cell division protein FtsB